MYTATRGELCILLTVSLLAVSCPAPWLSVVDLILMIMNTTTTWITTRRTKYFLVVKVVWEYFCLLWLTCTEASVWGVWMSCIELIELHFWVSRCQINTTTAKCRCFVFVSQPGQTLQHHFYSSFPLSPDLNVWAFWLNQSPVKSNSCGLREDSEAEGREGREI